MKDLGGPRNFARGETSDEGWKAGAACRKDRVPLDVFFPESGDPLSARPTSDRRERLRRVLGEPAPEPQSARPLDVCRTCPVRSECLEYALAENIQHGVWGGKTARQRDRIARDRRQRRRAS